MRPNSKRPGWVYTFYSYKGGVGRSMALANIAALLAKKGKKVLAVDWDLEAPGLEKYFQVDKDARRDAAGLIDWVEGLSEWRDGLLTARPFVQGSTISILHAGRDDGRYLKRVQDLDWKALFRDRDLGARLEDMRREWLKDYDFVLVDSRTGLSDLGGLCTIHLPDALMVFFTANEQSLEGVITVVDAARNLRGHLPFDRRADFYCVPVPSRWESLTEHEISQGWQTRFVTELGRYYREWLPAGADLAQVVADLSIPYKAFWSFGERLPVVEETWQPADPAFAYDRLANLVSGELSRSQRHEMVDERDENSEFTQEDNPNATIVSGSIRPKQTPQVFISGTSTDLRPYREAAKKATFDAGCYPRAMEHFSGQDHPPYDVCMSEVDKSDVVVAIVAHRYGWVPPGKDRSITWYECERARNSKKQVLAFIVDDSYPWDETQKEAYSLTEALNKNAFTAELGTEVQQTIERLKELKAWLGTGIILRFTTPESLQGAVLRALTHWTQSQEYAAVVSPRTGDPGWYLDWLRESTGWINVRGLKVAAGKANRFEIEKLYVPLTAVSGRSGAEGDNPAREHLPLEALLASRLVVIQGDAGSGKTTFLKRVARELARPEGPKIPLPFRGFPIFLRIAELDAHMSQLQAREEGPTGKDSPQWIRHFLAAQNWDLDEAFFEAKLREKDTVLLLDGLDEAANDARRAGMARLFTKATADYPQCRFVVTTRPQAYREEAMLTGWQPVNIGDLDDEHVDQFLRLWSGCLHDNADAAERHQKELREALDAKPEIRRMARNPVMLTALAVVHWNNKRMPEQRAELYESVVGWLAKARERDGREGAESCLRLLGHLALGMQEWPEGHRVQLGKDAAAGLIAREFRGLAGAEGLERARRFLTEEEVDSGIVTSVGTDVKFWHRTFQEYLAGRTLAGFPDAEQWERVWKDQRLHKTEWREVMLLLGGLLYSRGRERVDWLFRQLLETTGAKLAEQARTVGLVGAILGDLAPMKYGLPVGAAERYAAMREAVLGIFDVKSAAGVDYKTRVEAAEALGQAGDPRQRMPWQKEYWVPIAGGKFVMGAQCKNAKQANYDKDAQPDEQVRNVTLEPYEIGMYPARVWEYGQYLEATGVAEPAGWDHQRMHPSRPVVRVSYLEAVGYCNWAKCRLPSEEEWERAARGTEARKYAWGADAPDKDRLNFAGNVGAPSPVGVFPRGNTQDGIADMGGNVWEWTASIYRTGGANLVLRGGSWGDRQSFTRCSYRSFDVPANRYNYAGFRCARTKP